MYEAECPLRAGSLSSWRAYVSGPWFSGPLAWSSHLVAGHLTCLLLSLAVSYRQAVAIIFGSRSDGDDRECYTADQERLIWFYKAFQECIEETSSRLTVDMLRSWHRTLVPGAGGGVFRCRDVYVGSKDSWRPCFRLEDRLQARVRELHQRLSAARAREVDIVSAAGKFVYCLEHIHPFADANGRVGLVCLFFILRQIMELPTFLWTSPAGDTLDREGYNLLFEHGNASALIQTLEAGIRFGRQSGLGHIPLRLHPGSMLDYNRKLQYSQAFRRCLRVFDILDPFLCIGTRHLRSFNRDMLGGLETSSSLLLHPADSFVAQLNLALDEDILDVSGFLRAVSRCFVAGRSEPIFSRANVDTLVLGIDYALRRVVPTDSSLTEVVPVKDIEAAIDESAVFDLVEDFVVSSWTRWRETWSLGRPIPITTTAATTKLQLELGGLKGAPFPRVYIAGNPKRTLHLRYFEVQGLSFDGTTWFPF